LSTTTAGRLVALTIAVLAILPMPALAQAWTESFEQGAGSAAPYHKEPPNSRLEVIAGDAAEGRSFLRATVPDGKRLAGCSVTATGLPGGRLATVTAQVRGSGELWLCLNSRNGWLYSPDTVRLSDRWQTVSLPKALMLADTSLGIFFISREGQQGAVFEIDDIQLALGEPLETADVSVEPLRLEAEQFVASADYLQADADAAGGGIARHGQYLRLTQLPTPRTSRPLAVYLRVRTEDTAEQWRLCTLQGGHTQVVVQAEPAETGKWHWLKLPAAHAAELGDSFTLDCRRDKGAPGQSSIDSLVLATAGDLTPEQLDAAPPWIAGRPLTTVITCTQAPAIDGSGDDPCWQGAIVCTGFMGVGSTNPVEAATETRFCADDENLYVLFACEEPVLSVAGQRRHEFRATATEHDAEVSRDDSCVLILTPQGGDEAFDFFVNALGTVEDARCQSPDLWEKRDKSWDSGARAAGRIEDGRWSCELAIPLAAVGGAPREGQMWEAVVGRIAKARNETGAWNLCNKGFHDPAQMGLLCFGPSPMGGKVTAPDALQPGANALSAELVAPGGPGAVYLTAGLGDGKVATRTYGYHAVSGPAPQAALEFTAPESDALQLFWGLLDAGTLRPLYLSPVVPRAVRSTFAEMTITCGGPYELLVNELVASRGQGAEAVAIKVPLVKGSNVFALKLDEGSASVDLRVPGLDGGPVKWRLAPADTPDATKMSLDDGQWPLAPEADGVVGEAGRAVVLRHTVLWAKTRAWPTPDPALYIARESNQHLNFIADGLPGRKLEHFTIYLAVPPQLTILGSTGYYPHLDYQPLYECTQLGEREIDGQAMHVARIVASKPIVAGRHYIMHVVNALVRLQDGAEIAGDETKLLYWTEANEGTIVEPRQEVPVRILPALRGMQPKTLVWQLWGGWLSSMADEAMRRATLETAQAAGINDIVAGDRWTSDAAGQYGMQHTMGMNFQTWSLNMKPYLEQHPEDRLIDRTGKPDDALVCASRLLDDAWGAAVEPVLEEKLRAVAPDVADYDYEYPPFSGPHSCYCERCLEQFRAAAGLAADVTLTPESIEADYGEQWVDFMARRTAQILLQLKASIHRLAPGTQFSVYSGYHSNENPRQYGINWQYIGDLQACDRAGCGYGRPTEDIVATIAALQGIPAIFGALLQPYDTTLTTPQIPVLKARILRRCLDATGGVLLYDRLPMDGRTWLAIAETSRLVATYEDLFLTGQRRAVEGRDAGSVQVLTDGTRSLVCVMNHQSKPAEFALRLPAELGGGEEFYSGETVTAGQEVSGELEPGEAVVYVLGR